MAAARRRHRSWWEVAWPRFAAAVQLTLGVFIALYETRVGTDRPYLLTFAALLIFGAPGSQLALEVLARGLRGTLPPKDDAK